MSKENIEKLKSYDMNAYEDLENGTVEIVKETDKAIAINHLIVYSSHFDKKTLLWIPKSVAKIENNKIVALKGWFAEKQGNCLALCTKGAVERFNLKYS